MYYLLTGTSNNEDESWHFEWVLEADSIEAAKAQLEPNDNLDEIREISVEERIAREQEELTKTVKYEYLERRFGDCPIKEFAIKQRQMKEDPEMFYKALSEHNRILLFLKRLKRRSNFSKITIAQFFDLANKLLDANSDEEYNAILQSVDN